LLCVDGSGPNAGEKNREGINVNAKGLMPFGAGDGKYRA
jgi:hypothetical protein